jgi:hypothetical protein
LEGELLASHERHGKSLAGLRHQRTAIYDALVRGRPRLALELANKCGSETLEDLRPILTDHVLLLAIATAHIRIAELRSAARSPLAGGWAGYAEQPTLRQVAEATLIHPAKALHRLATLNIRANATDDEAIQAAKSCGLLADDDASRRIVTVAKRVRDKLPEHHLTGSHVLNFLRATAPVIRDLKTLKISDMNDAGWTRRSFAEHRFGVTAQEGAVIVAMNLLLQRRQIDACVDAILKGNILPFRDAMIGSEKFSNNVLARLSEALRIEGRSDRFAPAEPGDRENHNGKTLVKNTRKKICYG